MVTQILKKVRLTWFFVFFLGFYLFLATVLPKQKFDSGALTLFSVNSFLYGFYLAPILGSQKSRIEELHRTVRAEANAIFSMALKTKKLPKELRNRFQKELVEYVDASIRERKIAEGEKEYEDMIGFCLDYKGKHEEEVGKVLNDLIENQKNRTVYAMHMSNRVYSHEWMVIMVLFSITLGFVLMLEITENPILIFVKALLCTGLSMLLVILAKLSTLTHKKAKLIWDPLKQLRATHFYRID